MTAPSHDLWLNAEWLEADGLGGFASGTVGGHRTRRYHALLLNATTPPTGRMVLVAGLEVWLETAAGSFALSTQRYAPDVTHPDGHARIVDFRSEPWPTWNFRAEDGTLIRQEILACHGRGEVVVRWRLLSLPGQVRLFVRPLLAGRDYHSLHHENGGFDFSAEVTGARVLWRPYPGVPAISAIGDGSYRQDPAWYRNFQYDAERERGLDFTEDLASPGVFSWTLNGHAVTLMLAAGEADPAVDAGCLIDLEARRRKGFASPLERAADAFVVQRGRGKTIVAGYPWFTDWGRDTFIALRGFLTLPQGPALARDILLAWAGAVSEGMLPNRFPDSGETPEFNAVDASLWYVIAVHDYLKAVRDLDEAEVATLLRRRRADPHGLPRRHALRHPDGRGRPADGRRAGRAADLDGRQDRRLGGDAAGSASRSRSRRCGSTRSGSAAAWRRNGARSTATRWPRSSCASGTSSGAASTTSSTRATSPGRNDASLRPNQILAVGGLPYQVLVEPYATRVVETVERELLTPLGLRSLAPGEPGYRPTYGGGVLERDFGLSPGHGLALADGSLRRGLAARARRDAGRQARSLSSLPLTFARAPRHRRPRPYLGGRRRRAAAPPGRLPVSGLVARRAAAPRAPARRAHRRAHRRRADRLRRLIAKEG